MAHVVEEVRAFVTKKKPECYAYDVHPPWVMPVTPKFEALNEVHIAKFLSDGKELY